MQKKEERKNQISLENRNLFIFDPSNVSIGISSKIFHFPLELCLRFWMLQVQMGIEWVLRFGHFPADGAIVHQMFFHVEIAHVAVNALSLRPPLVARHTKTSTVLVLHYIFLKELPNGSCKGNKKDGLKSHWRQNKIEACETFLKYLFFIIS